MSINKNVKKDLSTQSFDQFFNQSKYDNKKLIPEQPQDKVIHCVNLYLTFNCDSLSRDQQSNVFLLTLPCTLVLCQPSSYTQASPKLWYVPYNYRSKFNILDSQVFKYVKFLKTCLTFNFNALKFHILLYTSALHRTNYILLLTFST